MGDVSRFGEGFLSGKTIAVIVFPVMSVVAKGHGEGVPTLARRMCILSPLCACFRMQKMTIAFRFSDLTFFLKKVNGLLLLALAVLLNRARSAERCFGFADEGS